LGKSHGIKAKNRMNARVRVSLLQNQRKFQNSVKGKIICNLTIRKPGNPTST
jgi:hypothetical protein